MSSRTSAKQTYTGVVGKGLLSGSVHVLLVLLGLNKQQNNTQIHTFRKITKYYMQNSDKSNMYICVPLIFFLEINIMF